MMKNPSGRQSGGAGKAAWWRQPWHAGGSIADLTRLCLFGLALVLLTGSAITLRWSPAPSFQENEVATTTVKAPRTFTYTSEVLTEAARREAAQDPSTIQFRLEPAVAEAELRRQADVLNEITRVRQDAELSISQRIQALHEVSQAVLTDQQVDDLLNLDDNDWTTVMRAARTALSRTFERHITAEDLIAARDRVRDALPPGLSDTQRNLAAALSMPFVRANVVVDTQATEQNRQRARAEVQPVRVTVQRGEVIIRDGSIVTATDIEKLEMLGLRDRLPTIWEIGGAYAIVAVLVTLLLAYLVLFQPEVWRRSTMLLVGMVIAGTVIAARLLFPIHPMLPYAFPVAMAAMLLAVLLDAHLALIVGAVLALLLGLVGESALELVVLYFVSAIGSAFVMWRADRTARFLVAGLVVAVVTSAVALAFRMAGGSLDLMTVLQIVGLGALNGVLSAGLTFVAFSLLGNVFGITTVLQLLELAHPNQPLLRRLAREAPGTYHHSIVVSSLAENAAELVGADPLFTRVAVYYHDIGKVLRPYFFIENQVNRENVHDSLDPKTSAEIILGHVTDGVALARRHRLPKRIVDIIQQHHGTTRVMYFYHRAVERGDVVDVKDFTYPGPRPRTKEAAIIMLADAVETTVRSQAQAGKFQVTHAEASGSDVGVNVAGNAKIAEVVNRIINDRLAEGQLDECDLTLKDIGQIRESFIAVLSNIYHPRVQYPTAETPTPAPAAETAVP